MQNPDEKCSLYLKVEVFRPVTLTLLCCNDNAPGSERNAPGIAQNAPRTRVNALHADKPRFKLKTQNPKGKAIVYAILV